MTKIIGILILIFSIGLNAMNLSKWSKNIKYGDHEGLVSAIYKDHPILVKKIAHDVKKGNFKGIIDKLLTYDESKIIGDSRPKAKDTWVQPKNNYFKDGDILIKSKNNKLVVNQKYICFNVGINIDNKFIPTPKKEQLEYPSRFYIDKNLVLHKDNGSIHYKIKFKDQRIMFKHSDKDRYSMIMYLEGKLQMYITGIKIENVPAIFIYQCAETNNWTLAK